MTRRILIVEDSPTQAAQLQHLLEGHGYAVTVAPNGREALAAVPTAQPRLIISDILMPEMDGYEFCRQIKSQPQFKDIPVMLVTELSSPHDVLKGLECGADAFIRKPFDERYLLSRINSIDATADLRKVETAHMGVEIAIAGQRYYITSERQQILGLLLSTYEEAIRLNEELKARQRDLEESYQSLHGLFRIAEGLNQATGEQEVAEKALERALELPGVKAGWIFLWDGNGGFRTVASRGLPPDLDARVIFDGDCICREQLVSGELRQAVNIRRCERLERAREGAGDLRYHASAPLVIGNRPIGILNLVGTERGLFTDDELKILYGVANQVGVSLERAQLHAHLEEVVRARTAALREEIVERERAEDEVREGRRYLTRLIESAGAAIISTDTKGNIVLFNTGAEAMLGYRREEVVGERLTIIYETEEQARAVMRQARQEGGTVSGHETGLRAKDGTLIPVLISASILYDAGGKEVGTVAFNKDLRERKRLEEEVRHKQRLEDILRFKSEFIANMSHELRTPLNSILGFSELLEDQQFGPLNEKQQHYMHNIWTSGKHLLDLINDILDLSKVEAGKIELHMETFSLREVLAAASTMVRPQAAKKRISLRSEIVAETRVTADPLRLKQIMYNLLSNAIKFTPEGGQVTVTVRTVEDTFIEIAVTDTGVGIKAEDLPKLFREFSQVGGEYARDQHGTGLGLALSKRLVELHGGQIRVESEGENNGSIFTFTLPISSPTSSDKS